MSRERVFTSLQQAAYILNLAAVCLVAGSMAYSIQAVVDAMEAEAFLELVRVRPWKPQTMLATALICYLCLVFLSCLGQLWEHKRRALRNTVMVLEMLFCIGATVAMNMDYNGLVLLVVADMVRGQKGSKQKVVLGVAIVGLYTIVNHNLTGAYFNMIPWEQFLTAYGASTQAFLRGTLSVFSSMNLVLFILYMTMLIQGEYRERERIQNLNDQLEEANQKLKEYAAEAEKNAEMRERNRLAREIHDTLGHALTGIVAGIDASLTMLDIAPEAAKQQLMKIGEVARQGITDVRRSVSKLRPDALEKFDLERAVTKLLEDTSAASGAEITFDHQVTPLKFHEDEEEAIYRVVQEATTNAIRHGHATKIHIAISKVGQWLTITVKDNGTGCGAVEEGFGLKHMQERLELLNGSLSYDGRDGFWIEARIPIRWGEEYG
ncbi:MAG: sensor histidine kinase [Lachnospiraceae bacterium]|nr:sensor histidine kinase [Lachnospiraceae bacterium]